MTRSIKVVTQRLRTAGCPLATVVNVLIGAPVMPLAVKVVNASRGWHEAGSMV
jgi:ACR3 family arsenite transporter